MAWRGVAGEGNGERARWSEGEVGRRRGGGERGKRNGDGRRKEGDRTVIVHTN